MKKKILVIGISVLLMTALVLTSCANAITTSATTNVTPTMSTTASTTAATTTSAPNTTSSITTTVTTINTTTAGPAPQYGATMTMLNDVGTQDPTDWDVDLTLSGAITSIYINPYLEPYFVGDIDTFGPRGSDATNFLLPQYVPNQYLGGNIAQSWSFQENPLSLTITLKQGIMWTGNSNIGMASRELTAADCVFSGMRDLTSPNNVVRFNWLKDCVAVDKYTFRWDFNTYQANWAFFLLYGAAFSFPFTTESASAGGSNWRNAVGTGPFILSDFVDGSSVTYKRNANYWGTATINGKQYQEPFVNSLIYLIVPDQSTELAALRTGKIDWITGIPYSNAAALSKQAPNMIQEKYLQDSIYALRLNRIAPGPLANLQVRQALSMATDYNTIANTVYGGGDILGWPVARGNPEYTPLSGQSAAVQALFSDNPTQAKQMLAAAGFANGFTTTITIDSSVLQQADDAQILASDWAQIGVTLNIQSLNSVALVALKNNVTFTGLLAFSIATATALTPLNWYQGNQQGAIYKTGEPLDVEATAALLEEDPTKVQADVTQFCKDALLDCGIIPMTNPYVINCYWPWLENYYGETDAAAHSQMPMIREIWINQTLKTSLGH